jgi:HPt (histidine-containing phosphotransfer) domain-containing protein
MGQSPLYDSNVKQRLEKLAKEYQNSVPEKLHVLQNHIEEMRPKIREDSLKNLRMDIHKMAGTAGTFGFPVVSKICKEFEINLIEKIKKFSAVEDNSKWIQEFDGYLRKIKEGFSHKETMQ